MHEVKFLRQTMYATGTRYLDMTNTKIDEFDKFRKDVYSYVNTLESIQDPIDGNRDPEKPVHGCLGSIVRVVIAVADRFTQRQFRDHYEVERYERTARSVLEDEEIRGRICDVLTVSDVLPMDVAVKITPVSYRLSVSDLPRVPKEAIFVAVLARVIADEGVGTLCRS